MAETNEETPQDGGGGYRAEYPARQPTMGLSTQAKELVEHAREAETRAAKGEDEPYSLWRARSLRMAAALVYEVCGRPQEAAEALRGPHS